MKIYERVYDNPINKDQTKKPNKFLGEFELLDGDMDGYSYQAIVKDKEGVLYILTGEEISGLYNPNEGGTKNSIQKLSENRLVKAFLKFSNL